MKSRISSRIGMQVFADWLRTELWPLPALAIAGAIALGVAMPQLDARVVDDLPPAVTAYLFTGGPEAARSVLQTVAGSLITVTSLTFSLTVVTLQLASGQYSPRLLRTFTRDRTVHTALAVLLGTFTYALTVLRTVRGEHGDLAAFVPQLSVTVAYVLAVASVLTVAGFLAHLAQQIRVESMLRDVHADGTRTIRRTMPSAADDAQQPAAVARSGPAATLNAHRSGFLASADGRALVEAARAAGVVLRVDRLPGASVIAGTPVATAWRPDGSMIDAKTREACEEHVNSALQLTFERTAAQDVAFAVRQITDVVVKALSPGVNDPTTAVHALGHASALLCEAAERAWGDRSLTDDAGQVRAVLARPTFASLLELAVSQPRRYGSAEPAVLARILQLLREVAWVARDPSHRAPVLDQLARTRTVADREDFDPAERSGLAEDARLVDAALAGSWPSGG
ncbi:DUF2254 domain-containing protein [Nucisporomicrobium flavum]|uniref:DUF2254 domain-containing protein n=1 Tax=Nucisporomicrobium flavum TaxID=2785915 RepID=UPI0018F46EF3|nr:DUF2254 domain-containing protein [Nucisporomicrobium flavum]